MIGQDSVLAVIPARGGSKGLPRKNVLPLAGKPLIAWTVEAARSSRYVDRLILSSDDEEIMRVAREWNCEVPFVRPAALASDQAPGIAPVLHALDQLSGYALVVLLQPTSPLRSSADIDACVEACARDKAPACVSVTRARQSPSWMFTFDDSRRLSPLLPTPLPQRRQDLPPVYALNGAVYVARTSWLRETRDFLAPGAIAHVMPEERSLDIDDRNDLEYAEFILQQGRIHGTLQ